MGLLDRVRILDNDIVPENKVAEISSIPHSPDNVDYPGAVFQVFKAIIGFNKGALLLHDTVESGFYPWISKGFDRTTTRRLRIPVNLPLLLDSDKSLLSIRTEDLSEMLSNRESDLIKEILILKLGAPESPSALLLASDLSESDISTETKIELKKLCRKLGEGITKSRLMLDYSPVDEITDLSQWLGSWGEEKAVLVTLDITNAIETVIDSISGLELYRARKDVVNLIKHLTGRMGRLYDLKEGRVLILFPRNRLPDYELYLHHLSHSFSSVFYDLDHPPEFPGEFNLWPEERDSIRKNLSGFF